MSVSKKIGELLATYWYLGDVMRLEDLSLLMVTILLVVGFFFYQLIPSLKVVGQIISTITVLAFLPLLMKAARRKVRNEGERDTPI